jgi:phage shock protein C
MESYKRIYRSTEHKMLGGVAGGLAMYFGIDPAIARILFVVGLFFGGTSLLAYLVMWVLIPRDPDGEVAPRGSGVVGLLLKSIGILIGVAIISDYFGSEWGAISFAVGLIVGLYFYWRSRRDSDSDMEGESTGVTRFYRSESDKKIMGVFGGLAQSFGVDATILRVIGGVLLFAGFTVTKAVYLIAGILLPKQPIVIHFE